MMAVAPWVVGQRDQLFGSVFEDDSERVTTILGAPRASLAVSDPAPANQHYQILLVEDDTAIAELYATILRMKGHIVTIAGDGLAGLDAMRSGRFDLVLVDIRMPRMNGLAMLRAAIGEQIAGDTPFVILTNYDDPLLRKEAAELGARDYLLKSRLMPNELAAQVMKWCQ